MKKDIDIFKEDGIGKLNDTSDIDMSKLQYTSTILETMKKDGIYEDLVKVISSMAFADKSKSFMVRTLKKRYPTYCGALTVSTFNKWIEYYLELSRAFTMNRALCLGELVYMGMQKAEKSIDIEKDDFIVKLIDRIDDGTLHHKNKPEVIEKQADSSTKQTVSTINRIMTEASRFGGLDNIEIEDEPEEDIGGDNE